MMGWCLALQVLLGLRPHLVCSAGPGNQRVCCPALAESQDAKWRVCGKHRARPARNSA